LELELGLEAELELEVGPVEEAAGTAGGGGSGIPCAPARSDSVVTSANMARVKTPSATNDLQCNLGISVFIPRLC